MSDFFTGPEPEIQVWRLRVTQSAALRESQLKHLSAQEKQRACSYLSTNARVAFVATRSALRAIIGLHLNRDPSALTFRTNAFGKPFLECDGMASRLYFNVSHCADLAVIAVTNIGNVGIDVENTNRDIDYMAVAGRFFCESEVRTLAGIDDGKRQRRAFFHCWTQKEAFIKAVGKGVAFGLDQFEVPVDPEAPAAIVSLNGDRTPTDRWSLRKLDLGGPFVGMVAIEAGTMPRVRYVERRCVEQISAGQARLLWP